MKVVLNGPSKRRANNALQLVAKSKLNKNLGSCSSIFATDSPLHFVSRYRYISVQHSKICSKHFGKFLFKIERFFHSGQPLLSFVRERQYDLPLLLQIV